LKQPYPARTMLIAAKKTESASALTVQVVWVGVRDLPEGAGFTCGCQVAQSFYGAGCPANYRTIESDLASRK
jgi:hypothetical protein